VSRWHQRWEAFLIILAILFPGQPRAARAAFERWGIGADVCGMSITGVAQADPLFLPFINPALGTFEGGWRFSTFYSRRYQMQELTQAALAFSGFKWRIHWSAGAERFGYSLYREERIVGGVGIPLARKTRVGLAVRFHRLGIEGYGSAYAPGLDLAWSSVPVEGFRVGAVWWNVNRPLMGRARVRVPGGLIVGMAAELSDRLTGTVEGGRTTDGWGGLGLGFSLGITRGLGLRMGYRRETGEYSLGASLLLQIFQWDYAFSLHPALGGTHYFSVTFGNRSQDRLNR